MGPQDKRNNVETYYISQEVMDLQHTHSKAVSVTCASFLNGDVNNFVVGSEDGSVYSAIRHGR